MNIEKQSNVINCTPSVDSLTITDYVPLVKGEKIRIVFLFQISTIWPSLQTIWEACSKDKRIEAKIILAELLNHEMKLHFLNHARNFLINNQLPFINDNAFSLESYKPHVIFIQRPYLESVPDKYTLDKLHHLGIRVAYVPYGIEIGGGSYNLRLQFNLPLHQQAWRIFSRSKKHSKMFAKYCHIGSDHVVALGHPRLDLLNTIDNSIIDDSITEKIKGRKVILWNPHFSIGQYEWSTFLTFYEFILSYFSQQNDIFLLARPHPLLFTHLQQRAGWSVEKINSFKLTFDMMPNAYLDLSPNYHGAFTISNALLSDASSFLLEYFATGKPVCYLLNPDGPGLNDDKDLLNYINVASTQKEIEHFIGMVSAGEDASREARIQAISSFVIIQENGNGEAIKDYIIENVTQHDRRAISSSIEIDPAHLNAENYWKDSINTYLAHPDYYNKQEVALVDVLNKIGNVTTALDVGCGDGRFTQLICKHAKYIKAIDISAQLVEQAKNNLPFPNVEVMQESITHSVSCHRYELISCMGVTSGLIDNEIFLRTVDNLVASCKEKGYLIMKDTLSLATQQIVSTTDQNGYFAIYRTINQYLDCFLTRGCKIIDEQELARDETRQLINKIFLFSVI